jgi:hypothetical protein
METANPYASPQDTGVSSRQSSQLTYHHYIWIAVTLAASIVWALFPIEELPVRRLLQRFDFLWLIVMGSPALYWELFCRRTPRSAKRIDSITSSGARFMFIYLWAFLAGQFTFASFAAQMWSNGDAPMTAAMKVMYVKHGLANACAVFFAAAIIVVYDHWRSHRDTIRTEQSDAREAGVDVDLDGRSRVPPA